MRGRSSSMETNKVDEESPRLSGAYIRTLVKHLAVKDPSNGNGNGNENEEHFMDTQKHQHQQTIQHKKQVRRRLHTSKPYQERLLNMAEARREIVTALKFHRASMKQQEAEAANNLDHQSQEKKSKSKRLYPSNTTTTAAAATTVNSYSSLSSHSPPVSCYWPVSTIAPPPPPCYYDNVNVMLPSQTLGLNLNFQNFSNLDNTHFYHKPSVSSSTLSASSSSTTSSSVVGKPKEMDMHHAMDDEEMEKIRSLGEQHQMEWNDTVNLMTSARWSNFLKTMEIDGDDFDQVMEFPPWLMMNANDETQQHFDDHFCDDYLQDPALPCMDIGEIEGMDGEWLA